MGEKPTSTELVEAAKKQGIAIAKDAMPTVLTGARWLADCVGLLRKSDLVR
jgi:hypothetical protein